jgi:hypothetical protein
MKRHSPPERLASPQHYWAVMLGLSDQGFCIRDVYRRTNGPAYRTVKEYVLHCARVGAIAPCGGRPGVAGRTTTLYRVATPMAAAPILRRPDFADDRGRRAQQLWTAMRGLRVFGIAEIAVAASTDEITVSPRRAREFIRDLVTAGYVAEVGQRSGPFQQAQWRLLPHMNSGPRAPAFTKQGVVDRNRPMAVNLNDDPGKRRRAS